jgi:hypothetical protein
MSKKKIPKLVKLVQESKSEKNKLNINLSYSQLSQYLNCNHQWYLSYVKKLSSYKPSIHTVFGTALHETLQEWLLTVYNRSIKAGNELDLNDLLKLKLFEVYKKEKEKLGDHFSTSNELQEFYLDGVEILNYLKKKRSMYFTTKNVYLAGVETMLYQQISQGVAFTGYIDLILYDEVSDKWLLLDFKTSTSGWNDYTKKDFKKTSQLVLYKQFFAKQFGLDESKVDIEYFILKRKIPADAEYASMSRRVQQFKPASGKIKQGQVLEMLNSFVKNTVLNNKFIDKEYNKVLDFNACRFCEYKNTEHCQESKSLPIK